VRFAHQVVRVAILSAHYFVDSRRMVVAATHTQLLKLQILLLLALDAFEFVDRVVNQGVLVAALPVESGHAHRLFSVVSVLALPHEMSMFALVDIQPGIVKRIH